MTAASPTPTPRDAGAALDADIARRLFGLDVLGITPCQREPECGTLGLPWHDIDGSETDRPVFVAQPWDATDPSYACGCVEHSVKSHADFTAWCAGQGLEAPPDDERIIFGHSWTHLSVVDEFSTDLNTAWTVVERLREIGLGIVIGSEGDGWEIEIVTTEALHAQGYHGLYDQGPSMPEVICRAALRAIEDRAEAGEGA